MPELSVNIDHVATVRQARRTYEPSPLDAARAVEAAGAHGVTVHLREDRRHIQDHDVEALRERVGVRFNLEMAATDEMLAIANRILPTTVMLVPEGRHEVTTEGGLDVAAQAETLSSFVRTLKDHGNTVSAFIDADERQIDACCRVGFDVCEIHTGPYAHAFHDHEGDLANPSLARELELVQQAAGWIQGASMRCNAGHGLRPDNVVHIAAIAGLHELHIGHSIVSRGVLVGMEQAVGEMLRAMASSTG
ncbi:MAG: pyridoxine 5'-phosphate synthase [Planctomycetota bacterium]|jgi:pyridoxine 5-phosphate synthase